MENNQYNEDVITNESASSNEEYTPTKFKKIDILVFAVCLLLAFAIWCYAHYINDPIVTKQVTVNFVLENASVGETLSKKYENINVYGLESAIGAVSEITVYVDRSEFNNYDTETSITVDYPEGVNSHTDSVILELHSSDK